MTLAADREELAQVLSTVDGVYGIADWSTLGSVGDASVRWALSDGEGLPAGTFMVTWKLHIIAGGAPSDAMAWTDEHLADAIDTLAPYAWVSGAQPIEFQIQNSGVMYGVEITCQKES